MVSARRLARLRHLVTLPETRGLLITAARSPTIRAASHRVLHDRAGLIRDLRRPVNARDLLLSGARHPAAGELASAGLLFLPARYLPLGSIASWAARRMIRRYVGARPAERYAGTRSECESPAPDGARAQTERPRGVPDDR